MTASMRLIYRRIDQPTTPPTTHLWAQPAPDSASTHQATQAASGTSTHPASRAAPATTATQAAPASATTHPATRAAPGTSTYGIDQPTTQADGGQHIARDKAATDIGSELGHKILCSLFGDSDVQIWLDTSGNTGDGTGTGSASTTANNTLTSDDTSGNTGDGTGTGSAASTSSTNATAINTLTSDNTSGNTGTGSTTTETTSNTSGSTSSEHISIITGSGGPLSRTYYHSATTQNPHSNIFAEVKKGLGGGVEVEDGWPHPFALGWVGALGYEARHHTPGQPATPATPGAHSSHLPTAAMLYADRAAVIDHAGVVYVAALIPNTGAATCSDRAAERISATQTAWLDRAESSITQLLATYKDAAHSDAARESATHSGGEDSNAVCDAVCENAAYNGEAHSDVAPESAAHNDGTAAKDNRNYAHTTRQAAESQAGFAQAAEFEFDQSRQEYLRSIAACKDFIAAGDSYEICLTTTATGPALREIIAAPESRPDSRAKLGSIPLHAPAPELVAEPSSGANPPAQSRLVTAAQPQLDQEPELAAYLRLRATSPVPYGAYLRFRNAGKDALGFTILSASPERFLRVSQEGVVSAKPIKGTRPRAHVQQSDRAQHPGGTQPPSDRAQHHSATRTNPGGAQPPNDRAQRPSAARTNPSATKAHTTAQQPPATDHAIIRELASNPKDRAENLMIVDLLRNDLGQVCVPGTVRVPKIFDVETYSHVHQLVSTIEGQLADGLGAVDVLAASFPGGSMTGAPKIRTMQIIDQLERRARGFYSGTIGWLSPNGAADLSITIRTLVDDGRSCSFGVGGAIVADSDPEAEYQEILTKASALLDALSARLRNSPSTV